MSHFTFAPLGDAEGYPGKRYYGGCDHADVVERIAIERAKALSVRDLPMFSRIPACKPTRRSLSEAEFERVGQLILRVLAVLAKSRQDGDANTEAAVLAEVRKLCALHPIYREAQ